MDERYAKELSAKFDLVIKLLGLRMVEGKPQREQMRVLSLAGLQPKEIAEIIGTTPNAVRVSLSRMRSEEGSRHARKRNLGKKKLAAQET